MAFDRYTALGRRLQAGRQARRLLQPTVAARLGVTQTSVARYERGERRPDRERLGVYAALLGIDPEALLALAGYGGGHRGR
jgi:transcriptional regulator with XRE-family HTH domain